VSPRVVLIGLPGSGKSTIGRRLAKILALAFADSDDLIEAAAGRAVRDIFAESGETGFRDLERAAVLAALRDFDGVLSLGGGALTEPAVRAALVTSHVAVVLLHAPLATLVTRIGNAHTRPLLADDPAGRLAVLADERQPSYAEVATLRVDTANHTPGQVASLIAARLHERTVRS